MMTENNKKHLLPLVVSVNLLLTLVALALSLLLISLLCLAVLVAASDSPQPPGTLEVINTSQVAVCEVYISAVDYSDWGGNWLDNNRLAPGQTLSFDVTEGYYDILLVGCNQKVIFETYNIPVKGWRELYVNERIDYSLRQARQTSAFLPVS
ncbi:MAG: hypothetical protein KDJ52_27560 [Anaerolineae bacterium]|nr:hypothetical protein [Anaerolineae bacterium]